VAKALSQGFLLKKEKKIMIYKKILKIIKKVIIKIILFSERK